MKKQVEIPGHPLQKAHESRLKGDNNGEFRGCDANRQGTFRGFRRFALTNPYRHDHNFKEKAIQFAPYFTKISRINLHQPQNVLSSNTISLIVGGM